MAAPTISLISLRKMKLASSCPPARERICFLLDEALTNRKRLVHARKQGVPVTSSELNGPSTSLQEENDDTPHHQQLRYISECCPYASARQFEGRSPLNHHTRAMTEKDAHGTHIALCSSDSLHGKEFDSHHQVHSHTRLDEIAKVLSAHSSGNQHDKTSLRCTTSHPQVDSSRKSVLSEAQRTAHLLQPRIKSRKSRTSHRNDMMAV